MKNRLIASLVGGIIVFVLQFLSWAFSGVHNGEMQYAPQQDEIMQSLSGYFKEDGTYLIPRPAPDASSEEMEKHEEEMKGKPIASVTYIKSYDSSMPRSMFRGFLVDLFLVFMLIYILTRGGNPTFVRWIAGSVSVGLFTFLWVPYTDRIWFQMPWSSITGYLVDAIVIWGICGAWLGWYFNRRRAVVA
ncbi:MAG TPA: hypothetical protein VFZ78_04005 [Flavisolibacter sp.]